MYYEEKWINNILHYRNTPKGKWEMFSIQKAMKRIKERESQVLSLQYDKTLENKSTHNISDYLKDNRNTAFILWQVEDVMNKAKELDYKCSEENAKEIIDILNNNIDCEYGITWNTIENSVINYFKD